MPACVMPAGASQTGRLTDRRKGPYRNSNVCAIVSICSPSSAGPSNARTGTHSGRTKCWSDGRPATARPVPAGTGPMSAGPVA